MIGHKSVSNKIKIFILILLLGAVAFVQHLYQVDSQNLEHVRGLLTELRAYCAIKGKYPDKKLFKEMVERQGVANEKEWLLMTSEDFTKGSLQYPMSLPILWAPGKAKLSEFLPVIYAFVIREPCTFKE